MIIFGTLAAAIVINCAIIGAVMWLLSKLHRFAPMVIGIIFCAFLAASSLWTILACGAEATFIPPSEAGGGEGRIVRACDGPGGLMSYFYAFIQVPVFVLVIGLLSIFFLNRGKNYA